MTQKYFYREKDRLVYQLAYRNNPNGTISQIALQLDSTESAMLAGKDDVPGWEPIAEEDVGIIDEVYANLETNDWGDHEDYERDEDEETLTFSTLILKQDDGSYRQIDTTPNAHRAEHILNLIRNRKYGDDPENN